MNEAKSTLTLKALAAALAVQLAVTASAAGGADDGSERQVLHGDMLGKLRHYRVRTQDTLLDVANQVAFVGLPASLARARRTAS